MSAALGATELVLAREQKLHALDGLAAAAAHELGTPLSTIVVVTSELAKQLPKDSPLAEDIELLKGQAQRCREILQKLTKHPEEQDPLVGRVPVEEMIKDAAAPYRQARNGDHLFGARRSPDATVRTNSPNPSARAVPVSFTASATSSRMPCTSRRPRFASRRSGAAAWSS